MNERVAAAKCVQEKQEAEAISAATELCEKVADGEAGIKESLEERKVEMESIQNAVLESLKEAKEILEIGGETQIGYLTDFASAADKLQQKGIQKLGVTGRGGFGKIDRKVW